MVPDDSQMVTDGSHMVPDDSQMVPDDSQMVPDDPQMVPGTQMTRVSHCMWRATGRTWQYSAWKQEPAGIGIFKIGQTVAEL